LEQPTTSATTSTTRVENQSTVVAIQVAERSTTSAIAKAVEQAQTAEQQLSPPRLARTSDAVTSLANTASNQKDLVTSFDCLLDKVAILVKIGDEVAKVWALLPLP
jgi:tRNA pseudouridine-54 N-methylase